MDIKLRVVRALIFRVASKMLRLVTIIAASIAALLVLATWALAHFVSAWWWLLLIPITVFSLVLYFMYIVVKLIVRRLYPSSLTSQQTQLLDSFIDKVTQLAEARATPPIILALISLKDIVLHRDITTIKKIVRHSTSLTADFQALARAFTATAPSD